MSPYQEASFKGIPFSWNCTKNQMYSELGIEPVSKWKLAVIKHKYDIIYQELSEILNKDATRKP